MIPIVSIDKDTGRADGLPEIVSRGLVSLEEGSEPIDSARKVVARTIETSSREERTDPGVMQ